MSVSECPLLLRTAVGCVMIYFNGALNLSVAEGDFVVVRCARGRGVDDFEVLLHVVNLRSRDYGEVKVLKLKSSTQPPASVTLSLYNASGEKTYGVTLVSSIFLRDFGQQLSQLFPPLSDTVVVNPVDVVISELVLAVETELYAISGDGDLYTAITHAVDCVLRNCNQLPIADGRMPAASSRM